MATCPECGRSSRVDPDLITVTRVLVPKPEGTYSVAGVTPKVVASERLKMSCRCGWSVIGYIEGDYFIPDEQPAREGGGGQDPPPDS